MNKDYTNKDALKQNTSKNPSADASKSINQDKSKAAVPPSSTPSSQQSKNR